MTSVTEDTFKMRSQKLPKHLHNLKLVALSLFFLAFVAQVFRWEWDSMSFDRGQIATTFSIADGASQRDRAPSKATFLVEDSLRYSCGATVLDQHIPYSEWLQRNATDEELACAAHRRSMAPPAPGTPRIAFLFMSRGALPLEPLWRKFFDGHEDRYSLYVHAMSLKFRFESDSLFYGRQIPSKRVTRFGINFSEAVRRLVSYALLDDTVHNAWFSVICEATIPIRPFPFVYTYIMESDLSFVEAFVAKKKRAFVDQTKSFLPSNQVRKGEPWITIHRRHAGLLVGDYVIFPKFKENWPQTGVASEHYMPTLFHVADKVGIANRTLVYVNWSAVKFGTSHPFLYSATSLSPVAIKTMQEQRRNTDGLYLECDLQKGNQPSCVYNGVPNSLCFLFARKFSTAPEDMESFMQLGSSAIGL